MICMTNARAIKRNSALLDQFHPITFGMPQRLFPEMDFPDFVKVNCLDNVWRSPQASSAMFGACSCIFLLLRIRGQLSVLEERKTLP